MHEERELDFKKNAKTEGNGAAVDLYGPVRTIGRFGAMLQLRKLEIEGKFMLF